MCGTKRSDLLLCAELVVCRARFSVFGRPVFGREGHAPEVRAWRREFNADFRSAAAHWPKKRHVAFLFFSSLVVLHVNHVATDYPRVEQYQRAMSVDRKGFRSFFEIISLRILAANTDANLHKHALAAAARSARYVRRWDLRHANLARTTIPLKESFVRTSGMAVFQVDTSG